MTQSRVWLTVWIEPENDTPSRGQCRTWVPSSRSQRTSDGRMPKVGSMTGSSFTVHRQWRSGSATGCAVENRNGSTPPIGIERAAPGVDVADLGDELEGLGVELDGPPGVPGGEEPVAPRQRGGVRGVRRTERRHVAGRPRRRTARGAGRTAACPGSGPSGTARRTGPARRPAAPGSSDSRQMAPQSKMAYGRLPLFCGLEKTTSPLMSAGHAPETTSSSKSRCGAVVSDAGTGTRVPPDRGGVQCLPP